MLNDSSDYLETDRQKNFKTVAVSIVAVYIAGIVERHLAFPAALVQAMLMLIIYAPVLAILLGIAYFIKHRNARWHTTYLVLTGFFCLWIVRYYILLLFVNVLNAIVR